MNSWKWRKFQVDCLHFARGKFERWLWFGDMGGHLSFGRPRVYGITHPFLGDHWVSICHLVRFRRFSRIPHRLGLQPAGHLTTEQRIALVKEIAKILNVEPEIEFTNERPELDLHVHPARNGKTLLIPGAALAKREFIAFQFDGVSQPQYNPTAEELESFQGCFDKNQLRRVGRPLTLQESMRILAASKLFIGVSSGMSHLAASASTPALIYLKRGLKEQSDLANYKHLRRWNPYPNTRFFTNAAELDQILKKFPFCRVSDKNKDKNL